MNLLIHKTDKISGAANIPGSKSLCIRNLFIALLAQGKSIIHNFLSSDDTNTALTFCKQLGSEFAIDQNKLIIQSDGIHYLTAPSEPIYTGNSGITTRFALPFLGLRNNFLTSILVTCGDQMQARPIGSLVDALTQLGLSIQFTQQQNKFPISMIGKLSGGNAIVSGITSQYISSLLLSLPCADQDSVISVKDLNERPYMEMTLNLLDQHKILYQHRRDDNIDNFYIKGKQQYHPFETHVTGDFSSASYILAAATLLDSHIKIQGLNMNDTQGDKRLIPILQAMGADIKVNTTHITIQGATPLQGIDIDANDIPDLVPTLAVIGTKALGKTRIYNVPQARIKETDRIHSMTEGLRRLGAKVEEYEDGLTIYPSQLTGCQVNGYDDHRTVMALAVAGLLADGATLIQGAEAMNKTFPEFTRIMQSLAAKIEIQSH